MKKVLDKVSTIINICKKKVEKSRRDKKRDIIVVCAILIMGIIAGGGLLIIDNQPDDYSDFTHYDGNEISQEAQPLQTAVINLQDYQEALNKIGLTFINVTVYPPTTDYIDWNSPHIGRLSQDIPVSITSEEDVDLLLAIFATVVEMRLSALSWDTCVDDAINEAGLEGYFRAGIRELTRHEREQDMIYLATEYTFDELVEMGLFLRPGIMKDFHELGFFLDMPEDFETSIDDFEHGWAMVVPSASNTIESNDTIIVKAAFIPWEMPWNTGGEITEGILPASQFNQELFVEMSDGFFTVSTLGTEPLVEYEIKVISSDYVIMFNSDDKTVVTDGTLIYVINDKKEDNSDGTIRFIREIDIYDLDNINIWYGTIMTWSERRFGNAVNLDYTYNSEVIDRNDFYELEIVGMEVQNDESILAGMIVYLRLSTESSVRLNPDNNIPFTSNIHLGLW